MIATMSEKIRWKKLNCNTEIRVTLALSRLKDRTREEGSIEVYEPGRCKLKAPTQESIVSALICWADRLSPERQIEVIAEGMRLFNEILQGRPQPVSETRNTDSEDHTATGKSNIGPSTKAPARKRRGG